MLDAGSWDFVAMLLTCRFWLVTDCIKKFNC
jgi:hypothetical protein